MMAALVPGSMRRMRAIVPLFVVMALALVLGASLPSYLLAQAVTVLCYFLATMGLTVLGGMSGQLSLGHGAFFAVGAYVTGGCALGLGLPYPVAVGAGTLAGLVAGVALGLPALRLGGLYLALATFSVAIAVPQLVKSDKLSTMTGGATGLMLPEPRLLAIFSDIDRQNFAALAVVALIASLCVRKMQRRLHGYAILAARDDDFAAIAVGINVRGLRIAVFGVSGMLAALGGGLHAMAVGFIAPSSFPVFLSIYFLVAVIIGGLGSLVGAFIGAIFIVLVPDLSYAVSRDLSGAVFGAAMVLCALFFSGGVVGAGRHLRERVSHLRRKVRLQETDVVPGDL